MSKGDVFESDFLKLIFQAVAIANIADNAATAPLTNLYVSLHTADPGEAGTQSTSEATYTGYARKDIVRTTGGFSVVGNVVQPISDITFPASTGGGGIATYAGIGTGASGAGKLLYKGAITPTINMASGNTPVIGAGSTITED